MGVIRQMDDALANRIAAGEVVERPASVVKELIENSMDAGATHIDVAIEEGGLHQIRIADNGSGMDEADTRLCLSRHATSKVRTAEDLDAIATFGFRGEALAAIFAVARIRIETRRPMDEAGTRLTGAAGIIQSIESVARQPGTTIDVRSLFHNTPARRRFVATPRAETGRVIRTVLAAALSRPDVTLTLRVDGEERLRFPGTADLLERIRQVHGTEFASGLIAVEAQRGGITVRGYVTPARAAVRASRRSSLSVNGRPVEDHVMRAVVSRALGGTVGSGLKPEAILHATLPLTAVDVNVSPDKSRVRYLKGMEHALWAAVSDAAKATLADARSTTTLSPRSALTRPLVESGNRAGPTAEQERYTPAPRLEEERAAQEVLSFPMKDEHAELTAPRIQPHRHHLPEAPRTITQFMNTYLIVGDDERGRMLLVDQHSAHERVLYERLRDAYANRSVESAELLIPATLRVGPQDRALIEEMEPFLKRCGFQLAPAGPEEMWIHTVPITLGRREPLRILNALLDECRQAQERGSFGDDLGNEISALEDRLLKTIACRSAIKSGQELAPEEIAQLWKDLIRVDLACHDVHDRPGIIELAEEEIRTRFERSSISYGQR